MSAFPVDVSRQSLRGDAITGHAAKRLIHAPRRAQIFDIADLTGAGPGQQPGEARQRLHQAGKVRLGVAPRHDELHEVGLARLG